MCEYVPSELIVSLPSVDGAARSVIEQIRGEHIENISYVQSLAERLKDMDLPDPELTFEFHRVQVPSGGELFKISYLQFFYKIALLNWIEHGSITPEFGDSIFRSDHHFIVEPNYWLALQGGKRSASVFLTFLANTFQV